MARIVPVRISKSKTRSGPIYRVILPKELRDDEDFPSNLLKQQAYWKIRGHEIVLTNSEKAA